MVPDTKGNSRVIRLEQGNAVSQPPSRKITECAALAQILREERARGRTVVQCHGCFDIVHPGHLRYFQFARQLGDVLVVSLTGDAAVAKGPDRPYLPQELRAENLAALEFVDWVVIDPHPTAVELLERLRPDVYVKGREYAASGDPRFIRECETVERYGGRVVFHSGEVVFSSSAMIRSLGRDEDLEAVRLRAVCVRNEISLATVQQVLAKFATTRVVVAGDVVRERYISCDAGQTADDAPILTLTRLGARDYWSGAAALAFQFRKLGARPVLVTAIGADEDSRALRRVCEDAGIELVGLAQRESIVRRSTFVADDTKLFRLSEGACLPLDSAWQRRAAEAIGTHLGEAALLAWCDCGCGMIGPGLVRAVTPAAHDAGLTICGYGPGPRGGADTLVEPDLLCVSERRLREAMHDMGSSLPSVAWTLLNRTRGGAAIVSLHKRGLIGFDGRGGDGAPARLRSEFIPTLAPHYADLLGVDDAVLALSSLALTVGAGLPMATYLAACGEALAAVHIGMVPVTLDDLYALLDGRPELRPRCGFLPDVATLSDLARIAPPLPPIDAAAKPEPAWESCHGEAKET